jgi:hypothetical protein
MTGPGSGNHAKPATASDIHPAKAARRPARMFHVARKYNGEWILADGPLAFNLEGWVAAAAQAYEGTLTRFSRTMIASTRAEGKSLIQSRGIKFSVFSVQF